MKAAVRNHHPKHMLVVKVSIEKIDGGKFRFGKSLSLPNFKLTESSYLALGSARQSASIVIGNAITVMVRRGTIQYR
mgnify:CR=1 FL=1